MSSAHPHEQTTFIIRTEASSLSSLLESGLHYAQQEHYAEAATCFASVREQLSPYQVELTSALEAFIQNHIDYWEALQALQKASRRFAKVDVKQQEQIVALKQLLLTLSVEQAENTRPLDNAEKHAQFQEEQAASERRLAYQAMSPAGDDFTLPALSITCLGRFEVRRFGQSIELCHNRGGQTVFRYLIAQSKRRATIDMLMELLWPEETAEVALHKLHVAMSALRRSLNSDHVLEPGGGYILCKNRAYELNPAVVLETDVDEFLALYNEGRRASITVTVKSYEKACQLYTGPFLVEDLYADWSFPRREQLSQVYLTMCMALADYALKTARYEETARWANAILKENRSDEEAHRQLILAYAAQGRRSDALRQYQHCQRVLDEELGAIPMLETTNLFYSILNGTFECNKHLQK